MEKPIVRQSLMAMCESIATTCCYALTGAGPASFTTTLHGGMLKGEYVYAYYTGAASGQRALVSSGWLDWPGGHVNPAYADTCLPQNESGEWYIRVLATNEKLTLEQARRAGVIDNVGYCPHEQKNCAYSRTVTDVKTLHVGSMTPHSAYTQNNSFLSDHSAYQYSS